MFITTAGQKGMANDAINEYKNVWKLAPNYVQSHHQAGLIYMKWGQDEGKLGRRSQEERISREAPLSTRRKKKNSGKRPWRNLSATGKLTRYITLTITGWPGYITQLGMKDKHD